jgi:multidrug resistance efflux pump
VRPRRPKRESKLAEAKQNVKVLKRDVAVATQDATKTKVDLGYQQYQKRMFDKLAKEQGVREEVIEEWLSRVNAAQATNDAAEASLERAQVRYKSEIEGINTTVANVEAQLRLAQYYLDSTTLTPEGPPRNGAASDAINSNCVQSSASLLQGHDTLRQIQ